MGSSIAFEERLEGWAALGQDAPEVGAVRGLAARSRLGFEARIEIDDLDRFLDDARHEARITGRISGTLFADRPAITEGRIQVLARGPGSSRTIGYRLPFVSAGAAYTLVGEKRIQDDPLAIDGASDLTTLFTRVQDAAGAVVAAGVLRFRLRDLPHLLRSLESHGDSSFSAKRRFLAFFFHEEIATFADGLRDFQPAGVRRLLARPTSELRLAYDVVIVGSGYGGGAVAARLAAWRGGGRQRAVCVLERGKEWRAGDFPDEPWELAGALRTESDPTGLLDVHAGSDIDVVTGNGLGGTSLINSNVMMTPDPDVLRLPGWPRALPDLTPYYARARAALHVARHPEPPLKGLVFRDAARKVGARTVEPCDLAVTFTRTERVAEQLVQEACVNCGGCVSGCNYTAKNTVDMTYLAVAEAAGAQLFTCIEVRTVEPRPGGGWTLRCRDLADEERPLEIAAERVVLAAGSLGSFAILARSRDERGLRLSPRLGTSFSGNGDVIGVAYNSNVEADPGRGPTITMLARFGDLDAPAGERFLLQEGGIPHALSAVVRHLLAAIRGTGFDTDDGWRDELTEWLRAQADRFGLESHGALSHSLILLALGLEEAAGRLELDGERVRVRWPQVAEQRFARRIQDRMLLLTGEIGGTFIDNPRSHRWLGGNLVTVHPLGGCPMGEDLASGVVSWRGEVFGQTGLYVADGSVIPTPLGANPALTIAALAELCADEIALEWSRA